MKRADRHRLAGGAAAALLLLAAPIFSAEDGTPPVPSAAAAPAPFHVCVTSGGDVVLSGESGSSIVPSARIAVRGPIVLGGTSKGDGKAWLDFGADLKLTGLPVEALNGGQIENLKAIELAVDVEHVIGRLGTGTDAITTSLFAGAGFTTVLPGSVEPRDHYARWVACGLRLGSGDNYIAAGIATDQRLDGTYQPAVTIAGQVAFLPPDKSPVKGVGLMLRGDAILGLQTYAGAAAKRDVARIGLVAGR